MSDAVTRLNAALEGRYTVDREIGEGGMATVYLAKGRYTIDREIGEGGMAMVYLATDLKHNRNVVLRLAEPRDSACERIADFHPSPFEVRAVPRHHDQLVHERRRGNHAVLHRHRPSPGSQAGQELRPSKARRSLPGHALQSGDALIEPSL